jgi:hypothetical protein
LKNRRKVENEAAQKEILKLRSKVLGLQFDYEEKEKAFKILEKDFIESRTEVQRLKTWMKKEHEFEMTKLRQSSAEVVINLSNAQVKMNDMKAEINHVRSLNENYQILVDNFHTLGNRCNREMLKTFSATRDLPKERKFSDFDLEGLMRWVLSETRAFKGVLSAWEDNCAWIGAWSTASVLLKAGCKLVKTCTNPDFKVSVDDVLMVKKISIWDLEEGWERVKHWGIHKE